MPSERLDRVASGCVPDDDHGALAPLSGDPIPTLEAQAGSGLRSEALGAADPPCATDGGDPAAVVARLTRIASHWAARWRGSLGELIERDDLVAEGWLTLERTGSWTRAQGAMRDLLRQAGRVQRRRAGVDIVHAVPAVQGLAVDRHALAWAMRVQAHTFQEIADRCGVSQMTAIRWIHQAEAQRGPIPGVPRRLVPRALPTPRQDEILAQLRGRHLGIGEMVREFGCDRSTARAVFTRAHGDRPYRYSDLRNGTHCARGHDLSVTRRRRPSGQLYCTGCNTVAVRMWRRRKSLADPNRRHWTRRATANFCARGHDLRETRRVRPNGLIVCAGCQAIYRRNFEQSAKGRAWRRQWQRERRARQRSRSSD